MGVVAPPDGLFADWCLTALSAQTERIINQSINQSFIGICECDIAFCSCQSFSKSSEN